MLCCIAIAFVIGVIRQGWRSILLRGESGPASPLPPPARRPQPSTAPAPVTVGAAAGLAPRRWESDLFSRARAASELRFAAAGAAVYAAAVPALLALDAAHDHPTPAVGWLVRDLFLALFVVAALVVARRWAGSESLPRGRERLACALMGAGAVWFELGILDQHVFGLFHIAHGAVLWDAFFHGAGAVAFLAGWALLVWIDASAARQGGTELDKGSTSATRRRPWRQEPSSAK